MKRIVVSEEADDALRKIYRDTWRSGEAPADAYVERFRDAYALIAQGNSLGRFFRSLDGMELRRLEVGRHVVIFARRSDAMHILALFHDRMDIGARLKRLLVRLKTRGSL
jgi:plasmid stabilization system protein ParE